MLGRRRKLVVMIRAIRVALTIAVVSAVGLAVVAPAQAAPTTQAAQITISDFWHTSVREIWAEGTVTCSQPTGFAHLAIIAVQVPLRVSVANLDLPCAVGSVSWQATLSYYDGWDTSEPVTINAFMSDDHGGSAWASDTDGNLVHAYDS